MVFWTKLHFITVVPTFIVFIAIAILVARILKKENQFLKDLPIMIIAIILVLAEIVKQVESYKRGYSYHHLPFHFCSMFVFLFPLVAFYKGRFKKEVRFVTLLACTMLFVFMIVGPATIYSEESIREFFINFFSFHTVFFHNLVILGYFYLLAIQDYEFNTLKDHKAFLFAFSEYSVIACVMSQVFKEDFNSFFECKIPAMEKVRLALIDKIDWVGQLIYVICIWLVILLFGMLCYWILRGSIKLYKYIKTKLKTNL